MLKELIVVRRENVVFAEKTLRNLIDEIPEISSKWKGIALSAAQLLSKDAVSQTVLKEERGEGGTEKAREFIVEAYIVALFSWCRP